MSNESLNLLPCPFCGNHAQTDFIEGESYLVECLGCDAKIATYVSAEHAIAAWNLRTPSAPSGEGGDAHGVQEGS